MYLSNIPHGFYEEEMRNYFKQFGPISHLRLARSKNTGRNKGFAFIEFKVPDVAKIVAETMNNYLMGKRLLKGKCFFDNFLTEKPLIILIAKNILLLINVALIALYSLLI